MQFLDCEKYWFTIFHPKRMKAVGWCAVVSSPESCPEKMWRQKCFHRYEEASQDRKTRPRECAPASEHNPSANACWHFLSGGGGSVLPQKQLGCHSVVWRQGEFLWRHSGAWRHGSGLWRHRSLWRHGRACGGTARRGGTGRLVATRAVVATCDRPVATRPAVSTWDQHVATRRAMAT